MEDVQTVTWEKGPVSLHGTPCLSFQLHGPCLMPAPLPATVAAPKANRSAILQIWWHSYIDSFFFFLHLTLLSFFLIRLDLWKGRLPSSRDVWLWATQNVWAASSSENFHSPFRPLPGSKLLHSISLCAQLIFHPSSVQIATRSIKGKKFCLFFFFFRLIKTVSRLLIENIFFLLNQKVKTAKFCLSCLLLFHLLHARSSLMFLFLASSSPARINPLS